MIISYLIIMIIHHENSSLIHHWFTQMAILGPLLGPVCHRWPWLWPWLSSWLWPWLWVRVSPGETQRYSVDPGGQYFMWLMASQLEKIRFYMFLLHINITSLSHIYTYIYISDIWHKYLQTRLILLDKSWTFLTFLTFLTFHCCESTSPPCLTLPPLPPFAFRNFRFNKIQKSAVNSYSHSYIHTSQHLEKISPSKQITIAGNETILPCLGRLDSLSLSRLGFSHLRAQWSLGWTITMPCSVG